MPLGLTMEKNNKKKENPKTKGSSLPLAHPLWCNVSIQASLKQITLLGNP